MSSVKIRKFVRKNALYVVFLSVIGANAFFLIVKRTLCSTRYNQYKIAVI